jgi:glyoxylase-like metal-dependent hydrolase (beta-lactamase superfamily II)
MSRKLSFKTTMDFEYGAASPISPGVVRVVARNPGPLTFKGTNTYLVGTSRLAVIDPGPGDAEHRNAILAAAAGRPVSHILVTHAHRDHVDGASDLAQLTGAPVAAFSRRNAPADIGAADPERTEYVNHDFHPDIVLSDGDSIKGEDFILDAIHTPGHAPDHLCFALRRRGIVFSGDHVMAWNTTVVAPPEGRMSTFLASLEKLMARRGDTLYLPGHGGRLTEPRRTVKAYLLHRRWREETILTAVRDGAMTIRRIVPVVYQELDRSLLPAACLSVLAHVEHLIEKGLLVCDGEPALDRPLALA